eukprot:TRINITY_DN49207_c0_g1_i1.p1 TRINITY_DN49207_c0_g1~~TRINITY_DN49207_c0_g1_i1.p1  ORF type:complete len:509 (+),score=47.89 TRINITY_DN49207_c0_g1_i1:38-1564(+)
MNKTFVRRTCGKCWFPTRGSLVCGELARTLIAPPGYPRDILFLRRCQTGRENNIFRQHIPGYGWRTFDVAAQLDEQPRCTDEKHHSLALTRLFKHAVLPRDFPESAHKHYLRYAQWTAIGLFAGRLQGVLATQAALFAVGLGQGSIPLAAAVQWILKDGMGHASGICYATVVNTRFDADAKRYRLRATLVHTAADWLAVCMPLFPQHFFVMASVSSAAHSMANVAQQTARARIYASFAMRGNLADFARVGQTHAKFMNLLGTAVGAALSWCIGPDPMHVIALMTPLAMISFYSTYASSALVVLRSFNVQRAERVFKAVLIQVEQHVRDGASFSGDVRAPSPEEIASQETFIVGHPSVFIRPLLLQPLIGGFPTSAFGQLASWWNTERVETVVAQQLFSVSEFPSDGADVWTAGWHSESAYAIAFQQRSSRAPVVLWHRSGASARLKLCAMWHACLLRHTLDVDRTASTEQLHEFACSAWPSVLAALESVGWSVDEVFLDGSNSFIDTL